MHAVHQALSHMHHPKGADDTAAPGVAARPQALELAQSALDGADTDRLNAVAHTLLGRVHHALGDLVAAQLHYSQVCVCACLLACPLQAGGLCRLTFLPPHSLNVDRNTLHPEMSDSSWCTCSPPM